jgi:hypothetical protein
MLMNGHIHADQGSKNHMIEHLVLKILCSIFRVSKGIFFFGGIMAMGKK